MNSIQVHNLWKSYGTHEAVKGISFNVQEGEIFAFIGPNGAGKSTTISILSTLLSPDRGNVKINDIKVGFNDDTIRKKIGIVFQGSVLDELLSVKQNLLLRCGLYNLHHKDAKERVELLCDLCHLHEFKNQKVKTLSGGQKRSADIARALIPMPSILILDEPSTGLDPKARKELWSTIKGLHQEQQMTIFLTTHYMEEAEIADHICMIQHGEIVIDAKLQELKQKFRKDKLVLYTDVKKQVCQILEKQRILYQCEKDAIVVEVVNFFQTMSILRKCEMYLHHFVLTQGKIEDVYLQMIEEDER